ncbi:MAG: glycoside hydrolase family 95 protein [Tannerella sp.]|nr:glycoside hydrolase family 95 protein [Tannerella sp.]
MKKQIIYLIMCAFSFWEMTAQSKISTVLPPVDFRALISKSDLIYDTPVSTGEEGMPVGNGVTGTLVWTTPSALRYQLNRVDVFANDESSNNFAQRHSDYCGGTGFLDIDFPGYDEVFSGNGFRQQLSCYEAMTTTDGKQVKTETFVWSDGDIMAVKIQDNRNGMPVVIRLRTLRPPVTNRGDHKAVSILKAEGTDRMTLTQTFSENDYICKSAMAVTVSGAEAKVWQANEAEMTLTVKPGDGAFYVFVSSAATFDKDFDVTADALEKLQKARSTGYDAMLISHKQWWKTFWEQSMVNLTSADGVADDITLHYNFFMYLMGSSSRGEYQTKFNGMLWSTGGDRRQWGSQFWGANQSCLMNGLFPANRPELMQPLFKMYSRMAPSLERAAVQQWGSKGIYIPETVSFNGLSELPENIAAEMRDLYLARKPWSEVSPEFMQYAATKMPHNSRWNWKNDDGWKNGVWHFSDKGGGGFAQVNHIFSRGAKIAYQYWMQYEYNQDREWLANQAYPMLKGVAEFYRNFPNLKKEADGKYHLRYVNDNESVWGGHNTVEEISSIMGLFPVAIRAAAILNVDADLRKAWAEVLANLSPLTLSSTYPELSDQPLTFVRSLPPTRNDIKAAMRIPDLNTMPVWFFDLLTLESTDTALMQIAGNTYDAYFRKGSGYSSQESNGIGKDTRVGILSKLPVTGTQMGRKDATRYLIPSQIRYDGGSVMRNRLDLSEGAQTTNVQRLGRVADALHNALCQSIPARPGEETVIRVFPALPEEWDAQFTLLCRGNFLVTSSFRKGSVEFVEIKSQAGKECKLRNPWGTEEVTVYRNGKPFRKTKANLIAFPTGVNDVFVLAKGVQG